jgi:polysaccharide biosynthesis/export protein
LKPYFAKTNHILLYKFLTGIALITLLASCGVPKPFQHTTYFTDSITATERIVHDTPTLIQPGDRLDINITAINQEAATAFMVPTSTTTPGYLVDSLGNIQLLQFGVMHVAGFSTHALADSLQKLIADYLKGPIVTVNIVNFRVRIFGEVATPGILEVPDGKITILDAIIQKGDLGLFAKRQNILVIREENGKREFGRVDITSNQIFNSPFYYLRQNDIVYVEPDKTKFISNNPVLERDLRNLGIAVSLLSTVLLIINLTKQ